MDVFDISDFKGIERTFPNLDLYLYSPNIDKIFNKILNDEYADFLFATRKTDFPKDGFMLYFFRKAEQFQFQSFFNGMNRGPRKDLWMHLGSVSCFMQTIEKKPKKKSEECDIDYDPLIHDAIKLARQHYNTIDMPTRRANLVSTPPIQVFYSNGNFYVGFYADFIKQM